MFAPDEPQRVVAANQNGFPRGPTELPDKCVYEGRVQYADWRHVDDLPVDELNSVGGPQNARLTHPVKRIDRDQMT